MATVTVTGSSGSCQWSPISCSILSGVRCQMSGLGRWLPGGAMSPAPPAPLLLPLPPVSWARTHRLPPVAPAAQLRSHVRTGATCGPGGAWHRPGTHTLKRVRRNTISKFPIFSNCKLFLSHIQLKRNFQNYSPSRSI